MAAARQSPRTGPLPAVPLARVELGDAVTAALRRAILDGDYAPGERLVEADLARRFGTSRGPVRDALATLVGRGLVASAPRGGTTVTRMTAVDVDELYALRAALETLAVEWAVARSGPAEHEVLAAALARLGDVEGHGDGAALAEADVALHRAIVAASGHARLLAAWEALGDQTLLVLRTLPAVRPDVQSAHGHHGALVRAVLAGDVQRALAVLAEHLDEARRSIRAQLTPVDASATAAAGGT